MLIQVSAIKWGALQKFVGSVFHVGRDVLTRFSTSTTSSLQVISHYLYLYLLQPRISITIRDHPIRWYALRSPVQSLFTTSASIRVVSFVHSFEQPVSISIVVVVVSLALGFRFDHSLSISIIQIQVITISSSTLIQVLQCKKHIHQLFP